MNRISTRTIARFLGLACAGTLLCAVTGCTFLDKYSSLTAITATAEPVGRVDIAFQGFIYVSEDTQNPGNQIQGLAGRVWLFGVDGKKTLPARGKIEAALYDMTNPVPGKPAEFLAEWMFHRPDLKLLEREDQLGLGYTLFLPWDTYQPSVKKVQLRLAYIDENGERHETPPAAITIRGMAQPNQLHVQELKNVPVANLPRK